MFDNLLLIAVVITLMWLAVFGYYIYTSRQQKDLDRQIQSLKEQLGLHDLDTDS